MENMIFKGFRFDTADGYAEVTSYNGSIVYLDMYVADEDGNCHYEEERGLTLNEVGHLMKESDGKNHNVVWREENE